MTFNTGNPIGSTDARDRLDNSENMDILENSTTLDSHPDRLGVLRKTRKGMELEHDNQIAAHEAEHDAQISAHEVEHDNQMRSFENDFDSRLAGMAFTRVGTFTTGATLTDMRQTLLWEVSHGGDGHEYGWTGSFGSSGKVVAAGSTPLISGGIVAGAWVDRTQETLRSQLIGSSGDQMIGLHTSFDTLSDLVDAISETIEPGGIIKLGNTSGIATLNIPSANGKRLFLEKQVTTTDDLTALQLHRNATYSGGTNGYVGSALLVQTDVAATAYGTFEWAGLFIINNSSPNTQSSENVAIYAQGNKKSTGRTWAGCLEITDSYNGSGSTVTNNEATIGLEITCRGSGLDNTATPQRMGLHVAITSNDAGEWGNGVIVDTDTKSFWRYGVNVTGRGKDAAFHAAVTTNTSSSCVLLRDKSTALTLGIDTSGATYSTGLAMRMALGQKIALDVSGVNTIYAAEYGVVIPTLVNMFSSFAIPSANRSTTATAGGIASLPATVSGFLNFKMDGTTYKLPFYAN